MPAANISDQFIVATNYEISTLDVNYENKGIIHTGYSTIDILCDEYNISDIEPFYNGPINSYELEREVSRLHILTIENENLLFDAIDAFSKNKYVDFAELYSIPQPMFELSESGQIDSNISFERVRGPGLSETSQCRGESSGHS